MFNYLLILANLSVLVVLNRFNELDECLAIIPLLLNAVSHIVAMEQWLKYRLDGELLKKWDHSVLATSVALLVSCESMNLLLMLGIARWQFV